MDASVDTQPKPAVRVFVSYARADQPRVEAIVTALTRRGYEVWWDRSIGAGASFTREIEASLRAADAVVVAWSGAAVASDWVLDEAALARDLGRLAPIRLDATPLPLGFGQYQAIDFTGWTGRADGTAIPALAAALDRIAGAGRPRPEHVVPPAAGWRRRAMLAAGIAAPLAVAGAWLAHGLGVGGAKTVAGAAGGAIGARSIAVLPFANLSGDPAQDYFSDGLSEELIDALARLGSLQVVARTSSFQFKGQRPDSALIGAKLGVAYLLDGSVRREGDTVRVSSELVTASTGFTRWSQTFERKLTDVFAVQDGISRDVAQALELRLVGPDAAALSRGGTESAEAYDAYLKGRSLIDAGGAEAVYRRALAQFDLAIVSDPSYAAAHAARAQTLVTLGDEYVAPAGLKAVYAAALDAAQRAAELAPALPEAQAALAGALVSGRSDYAGAKRAWELALAAGGGSPGILVDYGLFNCQLGDFGPGLAAASRAPPLDPLNPRVFKSLGYCLLDARRYDEAIVAVRRALALSPDSNGAHGAIGEALLLQGRPAEALREYDQEPIRWLALAGRAIAARRLGDVAGAEAARQSLAALPDAVTLYQQAQIQAQWGERARAVELLEAAQRAGDSGLTLLKTDPLLDPVRGEPRVAKLIASLGLDAA